MLKQIAIAAAFWFVAMADASAMNFDVRDQNTVLASGPIEEGDAAKLAGLPRFGTLELDSPGGSVGEALAMAVNMDARGDIRTAVRAGASCASACAMVLFVSGKTRIVYMGGRLGIHSCRAPDGSEARECNEAMAANATQHGVPWGVIEGFSKYTKPSSMMWLDAEDAECWGLMKWSAADTSNDGIDCFRWGSGMPAPKVTAASVTDADFVACRANAGTSRTYVPTGRKEQGFSDGYRKACEQIMADARTPKYAAIDIIMWLILTDPNISVLKPGTLMVNILNRDESQIVNCWKCLTIGAMTKLMHGYAKDAVEDFQSAAQVVKRETGSVPEWLASRIVIAAAEAAKHQN